ncbi:YfhJ family protein [Alkalihalobacterium alkalinitrilicum]|uniref:YfhJ family protein n=1 Tax=Alkalihalobacterium alkalinitrilicum TaxID=427920 RepID=UPI000994FDC1|nr:YfhJ family protein [Alkalihalobacterium alkalinitrilicum]
MNDRFERLAQQLLDRNQKLSYGQARKWVESLWEDFESTRAKAGSTYEGQDLTEQIVMQWLKNYGPHLHEYASKNEKFKFLLEDDPFKN